MIAITSISPKHANQNVQQKAVNSWIDLGMKVFSFNHPEEVKKLSKYYNDVTFIETTRTMEDFYGKPYVSISAMMDWAKGRQENNFCFINSDIELENNPKVLKKVEKALWEENVVVSHRHDYTRTKKQSRQYIHGIDVFFLLRQHLNLFPQSLLCMGQCFWDYHVPFTALKKNIDVLSLQNKFAFHKKHPVQYTPKFWEKTGRQFMVEHDLNFPPEEVGRMNEVMFNLLNLTMKKVIL